MNWKEYLRPPNEHIPSQRELKTKRMSFVTLLLNDHFLSSLFISICRDWEVEEGPKCRMCVIAGNLVQPYSMCNDADSGFLAENSLQR